MCKLPKESGSVQYGTRPVVVIQNNIGNAYATTTIIAPLTTKTKTKLPTHMDIEHEKLSSKSTILLEQVKTVDKSILKNKLFEMTPEQLTELNKCIKISFGI